MEQLTSRKLVACLSGLVSIVGLFAISAFASNPDVITDQFDKTLLAITAITSGAIGVQGLIDVVRPNNNIPPIN